MTTATRGEVILTRRKDMLKWRQLAGAYLFNDISDRVFRCDVCFRYRDSVTSSDIVEYLLGARLATDNSDDLALGLKGTDYSRHSDVSGGTEDKDSFRHR